MTFTVAAPWDVQLPSCRPPIGLGFHRPVCSVMLFNCHQDVFTCLSVRELAVQWRSSVETLTQSQCCFNASFPGRRRWVRQANVEVRAFGSTAETFLFKTKPTFRSKHKSHRADLRYTMVLVRQVPLWKVILQWLESIWTWPCGGLMGNTVVSENKCPSDCFPPRSGFRLRRPSCQRWLASVA